MNTFGDSGEKLQPTAPYRVLDAVCERLSDRIVLFTIGQRCDWWTGYFSQPVSVLMRWTELSRRAVQKSLGLLVRDGWLVPNGTRQHGIREFYVALDGPERDARPPADDGQSSDHEPESWRVEEVFTWAEELELRPTGADRAVIREWLGRGLSRLVLLGGLRLGKARKKASRDKEPIRSLRYFEAVLADLLPEKPDDAARTAFVKQLGLELGHRPALPPPPAVARRTFERREAARRGLEIARSRAAPTAPPSPHSRPGGGSFVTLRDALAGLPRAPAREPG